PPAGARRSRRSDRGRLRRHGARLLWRVDAGARGRLPSSRFLLDAVRERESFPARNAERSGSSSLDTGDGERRPVRSAAQLGPRAREARAKPTEELAKNAAAAAPSVTLSG